MKPKDLALGIFLLIVGALFLFFAFRGHFSIVLFVIGLFLFLAGIGSFLPSNGSDRKTSASETGGDNTYSFHVAGTSFRQNDICDLCFENDDYSLSKSELIDMFMVDEPIYQYETAFASVSLVLDPDNEYDNNAIKVMHHDVHLGFVPKDETDRVRRIIGGDYSVSADAFAGPYKIVTEEEDGSYSVEKVRQNVGLNVTIKY